MKRLAWMVTILFSFASLACSSSKGTSAYGESDEKLRIEVTVTYLEKILLPPASTVRAALYDETHELKPAISSNAISTREGRGVPVTLELTYPMEQIEDSHEYVVRAEITDPSGKLLFVTDEPVEIDPDDEDVQKVEMVLKQAE